MVVFREIAMGLQFPHSPIALADGSVLVVEMKSGLLPQVFPHGERTVIAELGGGPSGRHWGRMGVSIFVTQEDLRGRSIGMDCGLQVIKRQTTLSATAVRFGHHPAWCSTGMAVFGSPMLASSDHENETGLEFITPRRMAAVLQRRFSRSTVRAGLVSHETRLACMLQKLLAADYGRGMSLGQEEF